MYLLDEIDPVLRNCELVFGILNEDYIFSTGLIASIPDHNFIKRALEVYNGLSYEQGHKIPNTVLLSPLMFNMADCKRLLAIFLGCLKCPDYRI